MKPLHPISHIRDFNGNVVGMIVRDSKNRRSLATPMGLPAFECAVAENMVQCWQSTGNGIAISYTDEEIKAFKKYGNTLLTGDEYFDSDAAFYQSDIHNLNLYENYTAICALMTARMAGMLVTTFWIYRSKPFDGKEVKYMSRQIKGGANMVAANMVNVVASAPSLINFLVNTETQFGICTHPHDNINGLQYRTRVPLCSPATIEEISSVSRILANARAYKI